MPVCRPLDAIIITVQTAQRVLAIYQLYDRFPET